MSILTEKPIGVIYEHPFQFNPVLTELSKRGIPWTIINPSEHAYDPAQTDLPFRLVFNDLSNPPYSSRNAHGVSQAIDYTRHLEQINVPRIQGRLLNGSHAAGILAYKSKQLSAFAAQQLPFPATRVVNSLEQLLAISSELPFPWLIRANRSWTNLPPIRIDSVTDLIEAFAADRIYLDKTESIIVQSYIEPRHDHIVRIETINGRVQYAVKVYIAGDKLHAWPLEVKTERFRPDAEIVQAVESLVRTLRLDMGAIEYVIDRHTNAIQFLAVRPHATTFTTLVEDMDIDPAAGIADYIEYRLGKVREMELAL